MFFMVGFFDPVLSQLGISIWVVLLITVWEAVWKFIAMWKAAKQNSVAWFIVLGVLNTVGILPILYIYVFSKMGRKGRKR